MTVENAADVPTLHRYSGRMSIEAQGRSKILRRGPGGLGEPGQSDAES
jgi:hypothetical protein